MLSPLDELALYLRSPGQGIYAVSSGKAAQQAFTQHYLGKVVDWPQHLALIPELKGEQAKALLGIPSDAGAGIMRGAMGGPQGIREALGQAPVFDLGDIFSIPHFMLDDMLSDTQRYASQDVLYPVIPLSERRQLPVAPISIAIRVLTLLRQLNPELKVHILGGDHTCAWPMCQVYLADLPSHHDIGIIHFDAHTDMLPQRLGVKYCFGTWAYHANELLGRQGRLIQIGIRASAKDQAYWEEGYQVKQIWAKDALALSAQALAKQVVAYLLEKGIRRVYISNDIDATDSHWAPACGTPENHGLTPEHILAVLAALSTAHIVVIGADIVEVAPALSLSQAGSKRTLETAASYLRAQLALF